MNQTATRWHWHNKLSDDQRERYTQLLQAIDRLGLPCRCELIGGHDFAVVVAPGLPLARHWADRLDIDLT